MTMFHMTNDSNLFYTREMLEEDEGAYPIGGNRFNSPQGEWVPLYEGKMVQAFDHRAASVVVNPANLNRPAHTCICHIGTASGTELVARPTILGNQRRNQMA